MRPAQFLLCPLTLGIFSLQVLIDGSELFRLLPCLLAHLEQVHEHRNFGFQYSRCEGLDEVIHGANGITTEYGQLTRVARSEENNRRVLGPLAFANQRRGLKTIHPRHMHVEQDDSKVLLQHTAKSLSAGIGLDQILSQFGQDGLQSQETLWTVVYQQDVGFRFGYHCFSKLPIEPDS